MNLLPPAGIVQIDDANVARIVEIAFSRIDECQMAILADAQRDQHRRLLRQEALVAISLGIEIRSVARQLVERGQRHMVHQPLAQKAAE